MQTSCTLLAQGSRKQLKISQIWISATGINKGLKCMLHFKSFLKMFLSRQRFSSKLLKCIIIRLWKQTMIQLVAMRIKILIKMLTRRILSMWHNCYLQERWTLISIGNHAAALSNSCAPNAYTLISLSNVKKPHIWSLPSSAIKLQIHLLLDIISILKMCNPGHGIAFNPLIAI